MKNENVYKVHSFGEYILGCGNFFALDPMQAAECAFQHWGDMDLCEVYDYTGRLVLVVDGARALAAERMLEGLLAFVVTVQDTGHVYVMESRQGVNGCDQRRPLARLLNVADASRYCIIEQAKILGWVVEPTGCNDCKGFGGEFLECADRIHRWYPCETCNARTFPGESD